MEMLSGLLAGGEGAEWLVHCDWSGIDDMEILGEGWVR